MDFELSLLLGFTHRLPRVRGAGAISNLCKRWYNRKPRPLIATTIRPQDCAFRVELDPGEDVDGAMLFHPQLYDWRSLEFLHGRMPRGGVFLDAGANVGLYTLVVSPWVGDEGRVIAIDADPYSLGKLQKNVSLNHMRNVTAVHRALCATRGTVRVAEPAAGHRGWCHILPADAQGIEVEGVPLLDQMRELGIDHLDGAKFDLEGAEYPVLERFFADAPRSLWPRAMVVEHIPWAHDGTAPTVTDLLLTRGYRSVGTDALNHLLELRD